MKKEAHIGFIYPNNLPKTITDDLLDSIKDSGIEFVSKAEGFTTYASLEWAIPGILSVYILKPYFDAFLKEAGKDHYEILKKWLHKVLITGKDLNVRAITSTISPNKIQTCNTQSRAISIFFHTKNNVQVKLLFDETLCADEWKSAVNKILEIMSSHFDENRDDKLMQYLNEHNINKGTVFAIIDKSTQDWIFVGNKDVIKMHFREQNNK